MSTETPSERERPVTGLTENIWTKSRTDSSNRSPTTHRGIVPRTLGLVEVTGGVSHSGSDLVTRKTGREEDPFGQR